MKLRKLIWLLLFLPITAASQDAENGIQWTEKISWNEILEKAKAEDRYIFLDCYATWCGPCKQMDKDVYTSDKVGEFMNAKFISVKVQFDTTAGDGEHVQKWYRDAQTIQSKYKIEGFPTYLFFTPEGMLVQKDAGYKPASDFIKSAASATDPLKREVYAKLNQYKNGIKDYLIMPELAKAAAELLGDSKLSMEIVADYKTNYLDKASEGELLTKKNMDFIGRNFYLIKATDYLFRLMREDSAKVDLVANESGFSEKFITYVIDRDEIEKKLWIGDKPATKKPNWKIIYSNVESKYGKKYADSRVERAKFHFYKRIKDWKEYVNLVEKASTAIPPKSKGQEFAAAVGLPANWGDDWALNGIAWDLFKGCNNKGLLSKALKWSDLAIEFEKENISLVFQYYDTKANLLHKLGRTQEAIHFEQKSIDIIKEMSRKYNIPVEGAGISEYVNTLEKMKSGKPTWPDTK